MQNASKAIYCTCAIFDFTMLGQYFLYDNKTLSYMKHALYRLDKTKIAFENHRSINVKQFQPTFNYLKFHAITHFV